MAQIGLLLSMSTFFHHGQRGPPVYSGEGIDRSRANESLRSQRSILLIERHI